jgi:hypothetical protein
MNQYGMSPFEDERGRASLSIQRPSETWGTGHLAPESVSVDVTYHSEALARMPFLERAGGFIVLGFTLLFAAFLMLMKLTGQIPGQSFPLKSISDCLQFLGECIGLAFSTAITFKLQKISSASLQKLRRLESVSGRTTNSEMAIARSEARNTRRSYWAWLLLSIAIAVYACGQAIWTSYDVRMPSADVPFPGLYDIGFVAAYPFFVGGALLLTGRSNRAVAVGRVRILLDALLVIGAAFSLSWFFILNPSVAGLAQQPGFGAAFLAIYFPGGDLLLAALGAILMFSQFSTREQQAVFARLCLGLFFLAITDSILVWLSLSSSFNTGTLQDILWPLSMQMVGLAAIAYPRSVALEQERAVLLERGAGAGRLLSTSKSSTLGRYVQTAAPFVLALGTSAILLTIIPETDRTQHFLASLSALILFVLVAVRQTLTLNENNHLRLQLAGELVLSRRELQVTRREADIALREAQEKQQLEQGVLALQTVHARIAHGDFNVRAPTDPGPLQAVAVSFNLMIERLKDLVQRANAYEQLVDEIALLQAALERLSKGTAAWPPATKPSARTEFRALTLGIEHVQRFQISRWSSLLMALERIVAPLARLRTTLKATEQPEKRPASLVLDDAEKGAVPLADDVVLQLEQQLQRLIEQVRYELERLEGQPGGQGFPSSPLPPPGPGNAPGREGLPPNRPNYTPHKASLSPRQE